MDDREVDTDPNVLSRVGVTTSEVDFMEERKKRKSVIIGSRAKFEANLTTERALTG